MKKLFVFALLTAVATGAALAQVVPDKNPPSAGAVPATSYLSAINGGLVFSSMSSPALDGTYAVDQQTQFLIVEQQLSIMKTGAFTNGQATHPWPDTSGVTHTFTVAQFNAFAAAVEQYGDAFQIAPAQSLPTNQAAIP